jgi:dihydroorotase-like cyclic amidohydrolase
MSIFDLAIKGGTVVTAADVIRCDIAISDGRIAALANQINDATEVIDATGLLVMPGGIDSHVHLAQLAYGAQMADDFESGSRSALAGGNTTIIPFSLQPRGKSLRESVREYHKLADGKCHVDYGFHLIITDPTPTVLGQELPALVADGYSSFKVFMTYDDMVLNDRQLLEVFECARRERALSLTADDLKGLNMDETGGKYVCSPPPRDQDSWAAIWEGITQGVFKTFSSDHCPYFYEGPSGKLNPKARTSFRWVPNGIPGVETRLPILFSEGVVKRRISLEQFVALTSTNHAKMYGLYPQKGSIAVGCDADLVIWDSERKVTITQDILHHGADYTPWEGFEVTGWPLKTILRGRLAFDGGKILGQRSDGKFLARGLSPYATPQRGHQSGTIN